MGRVRSFTLKMSVEEAQLVVAVLEKGMPGPNDRARYAVERAMHGFNLGIRKILADPKCRKCGHLKSKHRKGYCTASYSAGPSGNHRCGCEGFVDQEEVARGTDAA